MPRFRHVRMLTHARTLVAVALAGAIVGMGLGATPASFNPAAGAFAEVDLADSTEPAAPTPAPEETDASTPDPQVSIAPVESQLMSTSDEMSFLVRIANPAAEPLPGGTVRLSLSLDPITDALSLEPDVEIPMRSLGVFDAGETSSEGDQTLTLTVPRDELPLSLLDPSGVYRVDATFIAENPDDGADTGGESPAPTAETSPAPSESTLPPETPNTPTDSPGSATHGVTDGARVIASTAIVWRGTGSSHRVALSTIIPLVLPTDTDAVPTPGQLGDAAERLTALIDTAETNGATLAIDPRIFATIRAYGTRAPEAARTLLDRLEQTTAPNFLLQFADADPAAQAAIGLDELLAPTSLSFVTREGEQENPAAESDSDSESPDAASPTPQNETPGSGETAPGETDPGNSSSGEDPVDPESETAAAAPTLDELLSWQPTTDAAWPAAGAVDRDTISLLTASGVESLVLDSTNTQSADAPRISISGLETVVTDAALGEWVRIALSPDSETERLGAIARATAELALLAQQDTNGIVIGVDRLAIADTTDAADLISLLSELDWVEPVEISEQTTGAGTLRAGGTSEERATQLRSAVVREAQVDELRVLLEDPVYLTGYQRTRLLVFFATAHASPDADFSAIAEDYRDRDTELLQGVHVILGSQAQLVGTSTRVPVQVHNSLPFDAIITGEARPASAAIRVPERDIPETTVPADGNHTVLVPVETRVSSGTSGLLVTLSDRAGTKEFFTGVIPLSISSAVETIALSALGVLTALLLGLGVWRSVRQRRTAVAHSGTTGESDTDGSSTGKSDTGEARTDES